MSNRKKVNISQKPDNKVSNIDQWVTERTTDSTQQEQTTEKMKRLTLDIPESLHQAIKLKAVEQGVTMANMLRALLEEHYG
jgi:predicted DNA binding CopG/RHH family protein